MSHSSSSTEPLMAQKSKALKGVIRVAGDKSISHRALIFGALAEGRTSIEGLLEGEDILCTALALRAMGVHMEKKDDLWQVRGVGLGGLTQPKGPLDFGNAGTGSRLMMGVVAGHPLRAVFTGDASLCRRPMGRVLEPLVKMGLDIEEKGRLTLPLTLIGTRNLAPIVYHTPVPSAQVKSAILLAGLLTPGKTIVIEKEKTRDHTEKMLQAFGAVISTEERSGEGFVVTLEGQHPLKGQHVLVPGDPSSAAFLVAAALITPDSDVVIENVLVNPTRTGFYQTLLEMGANLTFENQRIANGETIANVRARSSQLRGVRVAPERAPSMIDEYPCLAVVAAFADGETVMEGLGELRVKESDRLAVMVEGLAACGVDARAEGDTMIVKGGAEVKGGATVATHMDHRIAMSFIILGLSTKAPVVIDDASMIKTSFPEFRQLLESLGGRLVERI